jgi:mediator of RNA polymerase II transcription subunit 14
MELASMPVPSSAQLVGASGLTEVDDLSPENLAKKKALLDFAQSTHADWVKALVITNWSRRSEDVSKTIDLNVYTNQQKALYDMAIHEMAELKRGLGQARLPNPDLKTALQVLSTGKAPYMPEVFLC